MLIQETYMNYFQNMEKSYHAKYAKMKMETFWDTDILIIII